MSAIAAQAGLQFAQAGLRYYGTRKYSNAMKRALDSSRKIQSEAIDRQAKYDTEAIMKSFDETMFDMNDQYVNAMFEVSEQHRQQTEAIDMLTINDAVATTSAHSTAITEAENQYDRTLSNMTEERNINTSRLINNKHTDILNTQIGASQQKLGLYTQTARNKTRMDNMKTQAFQDFAFAGMSGGAIYGMDRWSASQQEAPDYSGTVNQMRDPRQGRLQLNYFGDNRRTNQWGGTYQWQ